MSGREDNSEKIDLQLNLSPPIRASPARMESSNTSVSFLDMSLESSCVSSEVSSHTEYSTGSPEETSPMMLVGCPRCLMYVMLSEVDPKCPRCKSTVLLDFLNDDLITKKSIN